MTAFLTRLVVSIVLGFVVLVVVRWTGPAQISRPNERFHSNIESNNQKNTRRLIDSDVALLLSLHAAEKHLNQSHSPSIANDKPVKADVLWGDFIDAQKASGCIASNSHSSARVSSLDTRGLRRCRSKPSSSRILAENCMEEMDAAFLRKWRYNNDSDSDTQCEREASSKITCYTSPNKSKLCVFQNAMIDFRKMRRRVQGDGTVLRLWERGFIAADCGYTAKDEIEGYFPQYKPDIEGQSDALCDFVFNETVVAYSHDNIKHLGHTMNDVLNVWSMLWLTGLAKQTQAMTFLNIDGFRKGKVYDDQLYQFFSHYRLFFKRVIGASDLLPSKRACFRRLVFFPKPMLLFIGDRSRHIEGGSATLPSCLQDIEKRPNPLFQRWNLHFRSSLDVLGPNRLSSKIFRVIILRKHNPSILHHNHDNSLAMQHYNQSRQFLNALTSQLQQRGKKLLKKLDVERVSIEEMDTSSIGLHLQAAAVAKANILIGIHGSGINALSIHMPIGVPNCCGVIELFVGNTRTVLSGYRNAAQSMGHHYKRMEVKSLGSHPSREDKSLNEVVEMQSRYVHEIVREVETSISFISKNTTCILSEALDGFE